MNYWQQQIDSESRERPVGQREPISLFLQRVDTPYYQPIHCMKCGRLLVTITNAVINIVSDSTGVEDIIGVQYHCKRCSTPYRIFL